MAKKTNKSSQQTQLPQYLESAYKGILQAGAKTAKQPLKQYTGSQIAGFTPMQQQGFQQIGQAQGMGLPYINAAADAYGGVNNLNWGGIDTDTVDYAGLDAAGQPVMPGVDKYDWDTLTQYMDPYLQGVIDPTMQRMHQEDAKQVSNLKGSGIAGFGVSPALGDRMGLAASDLSGQQALSRNQVLGGLQSQGFQNAQSQLNAQQQLQLQGGTSDQARLLQVAQLRQQGRQADADRLLASLGMQQQGGLAAAQGIAGLGQQAQDMTLQGIDYMMNAGQMQQQLGQAQLDQTKADWLAKQNYPKSQVEWLANLIYGNPGAAGSTTTTETPAPSVLSQLLGLGTAAAGFWGGKKSHGGVVRRAPGGFIPQIDVRDFQVDTYGWPAMVPSGLEPAKHGVFEGDWYTNALPNLKPRQVGNDPRVTKLPKDLRKIFGGIGRAANIRGGGDNRGQKDLTKDGRGVIRRWPDGTIKTVGGKPVKRATGGMIPGTPEYDAEVKRLLMGETESPVASVTGDSVVPPPSGGGAPGGLGGRGGERPSFFENKNLPLIYAGLGIAGGESPWPLQNIGSGALAGLTAAQGLYEKEMDLDANPVVDDSGPTIRIWYPSEKRWEDTGIPTARWQAATDNGEKTETERRLRAKYGEGWTSNPKALEEWTETANKPAMVFEMGGGKKFSEGLQEEGLKTIQAANDAAKLADDYNLMATMVSDPNVYTGAGGAFFARIKEIGGTMFGLPVEGMAEADIINQTQSKMVLNLTSLMKGVLSDKDVAELRKQTVGLGNSTEGIMLSAELANLVSNSLGKKKNKLMQLMGEAEQDNRSTTSALIEYQNWIDLPENQVFTPEAIAGARARADARTAAAGGQKPPTAGAGPALDDVKKRWGLD